MSIEMRYLACKPKLTKEQKARKKAESKDNPVYLGRVTDSWLKEQDNNKPRQTLYMTPSSQIRFKSCAIEYFKSLKEVVVFPPDTLYATKLGNMVHTGVQKAVSKIPDMRVDYPDYKGFADRYCLNNKNNLLTREEFLSWTEYTKPEFAIYDPVIPMKGKVDDIVYHDYYGVVLVDLKTTNVDKYWWDQITPSNVKEEYKAQICIYINRANALRLFPFRIDWGCLSYVNFFGHKPFTASGRKEIMIDYEKYREKTNHLVWWWAVGSKELRETGTVSKCRNKICERGCNDR